MNGQQIKPLVKKDLAKAMLLLAKACPHTKSDRVAYEKLFAPGAQKRFAQPLGAFQDNTLLGLACTSGPWLRILAVDPAARRQGIGSSLLKKCESQVAEHASVIRCLDQPGNYVSPGVSVRNQDSIQWLLRKGFVKTGHACNLLISLQDNKKVSEETFLTWRRKAKQQGYLIQRMNRGELEDLMFSIRHHFSEGWAFEVQRASTNDPQAVFVAKHIETGKNVAFAAHDGNNQGLGSFGPTGTWPDHRRQGLGAALLLACLLDIKSSGHTQAEVAWIGPRGFYARIAGIEAQRQFITMKKELL